MRSNLLIMMVPTIYRIVWNGFYIKRNLDWQKKQKYLFVKDMLVLKRRCSREDGMKILIITVPFSIWNSLSREMIFSLIIIIEMEILESCMIFKLLIILVTITYLLLRLDFALVLRIWTYGKMILWIVFFQNAL